MSDFPRMLHTKYITEIRCFPIRYLYVFLVQSLIKYVSFLAHLVERCCIIALHCRSRGARASENAEQMSAATSTLVRHLRLRDDEMREHDHGVRRQEPQAGPELREGNQRAGLHAYDFDGRRRSDNAGRRRRLRRWKVGFTLLL